MITDCCRENISRGPGRASREFEEVLLIMEGTDFEDRTHRQIIETLCPNAGSIYHQLL